MTEIMTEILTEKYPHIQFRKNWELSEVSSFLLGQCDAFIKAINNTPIEPKYYQELMKVALIKGAQATTAIEGNTLTDEEIEKIEREENLPPSKEYQEIEVRNVIDAFNSLFTEIINNSKPQLICKELLLNFHKLIGKDLGDHFEAIPGRFRENYVTVGRYRAPDYKDVEPLINNLCDWLRREFKFEDGKQKISEAIIQAIVTHIYIEWIHPFGDGNGRTGRLVEFYILLRSGCPKIALHVLSNHYNLTRSEYYKQIEKATQERNLSKLIQYALLGFRDGLQQILEKIQEGQTENTWRIYIYDVFSDIKIGQRIVFKRRRKLALEFPLDRGVSLAEIPKISIETAMEYSSLSEKTVQRDVEELISAKLLIKENNKYYANLALLNKNFAVSRSSKKI